MTTSLTNESKNALTISNDSKSNEMTWDEADFTWDDAEGTWDVPRTPLTKETKNSITLSNETKN